MLSKINNTYESIMRRTAVHEEPFSFYEEQIEYAFDLICESIFPKPMMLISDIKNRIKKEKEIVYHKEELLRLLGRDWKYIDKIKDLPQEISVTVLCCPRNELLKKLDFVESIHGHISELNDVSKPEEWIHEYVWIDEDFEFDKNTFIELMQHELGHIWTFFIGNNDKNFKVGQTENSEEKIDVNQFTRFQFDVYSSFYYKNLEDLENDYHYILNSENEPKNYEFTAILDEIIDVLVEDYLEEYEKNKNLKPETYLMYFIGKLFAIDEHNRNDFSYSSLNIIKHFNERRPYSGLPDFRFIYNAVRRLMLMFAFGTLDQKQMIVKYLQEEFGEAVLE